MRRSEINSIILDAQAFLAEHRFVLPPFASWTPASWGEAARDSAMLRRLRLGWDVTDFGSGRFADIGLLLFTLRNGDVADAGDPRCYAEKIMVVRERQVTPWHFHWMKAEDIINRGGGELIVDLAWATDDETGLADRPVEVFCDGLPRRVPARGSIVLHPGESITLPPRLYHQFHGAAGRGTVLVGEVSRTNDDTADNRFLDSPGRFPQILEDEPPYRLLCHEYPEAG